jgi:hypothetical protein
MTSNPFSEAGTGGRPSMPRQPLGTVIFQKGLLSAEQLLEALEEGHRSRRRLGDILLERGWLDEQALAETLAEQYGLPVVELEPGDVDVEAAKSISAHDSERLDAIVMCFQDGAPIVAVSDPSDAAALAELETLLGLDVRFAVAAPARIEEARKSIFAAGEERDYVVSGAAAPVSGSAVPHEFDAADTPSAPGDESEPALDVVADSELQLVPEPVEDSEPEADPEPAEQAPEWLPPAEAALELEDDADEAPTADFAMEVGRKPESGPPAVEPEPEPAIAAVEPEPEPGPAVVAGADLEPEPERDSVSEAEPAVAVAELDREPKLEPVAAELELGPVEAAAELELEPVEAVVEPEPEPAEALDRLEPPAEDEGDELSWAFAAVSEPASSGFGMHQQASWSQALHEHVIAPEDAEANGHAAEAAGPSVVVLRFADGTFVEVGSFADRAGASVRAAELIAQLIADEHSSWTEIAGSHYRLEAIIAVEVVPTAD